MRQAGGRLIHAGIVLVRFYSVMLDCTALHLPAVINNEKSRLYTTCSQTAQTLHQSPGGHGGIEGIPGAPDQPAQTAQTSVKYLP
jgi:hypothetical protein